MLCALQMLCELAGGTFEPSSGCENRNSGKYVRTNAAHLEEREMLMLGNISRCHPADAGIVNG